IRNRPTSNSILRTMTRLALDSAWRAPRNSDRAVDKVRPVQRSAGFQPVSNLLYRRFPIGRPPNLRAREMVRTTRRLEALRYGRLETCATTLSAALCCRLLPAPSFALASWPQAGAGYA